MSLFQKYPYLFVSNGKFKVAHASSFEVFILNNIKFCKGDKRGPSWYVTRDGNDKNVNIEECILVARPIIDMTEKEVYNTPMFSTKNQPLTKKDILIRTANAKFLSGDDERYLASLGVYFGPQRDFKPSKLKFPNGETLFNPSIVIDINEL